MRAARLRRLAGTIVLALAASASAVPVVVTNGDGASEGFNDPTPMAPVGGNTGTTLGAQRLQAFQFAADLWARRLVSAAPVRVTAVMNPLTCDATSAVLGQATPASVYRDFPGAPAASTWFASALANKLAGTTLIAGTPDVLADFNSAIGTTCSFPQTWYYGLDANPPANTIDFVTVVAHELAHGLGFLTFVDEATGAKFMGLDDPFEQHLLDGDASWPDLTDAERDASATSGSLRFAGAATAAASVALTSGADAQGRVLMFSPSPVQQGSSVSHFDVSLTPSQLLEPFYTHAIHATDLTRAVLADIGWGTEEPSVTTTTVVTSTSLPTTTTLPLVCPPAPATGCLAATPAGSSVRLVERAASRRNRLRWTWKGAVTDVARFGQPTAPTTTLLLCLYDASASAQPILAAAVPAGDLCGASRCWRTLGRAGAPTGYLFRDRAALPDGVVFAKLRTHGTHPAAILVKAKGANLPVPPLGLTPPVTAQLLIGDATANRCFESTFASARRNDTSSFVATGP